jgi:membrane fusion protein, multidrug efflux system
MRKALAAGAIVLALVAGGFGVRLALRRTAPVAAAASPAAVPAVPVTLGVVKPANLPVFLRGIGTVQAYSADTIRSRVDGEIVGVGFTEGQEVKAGTLLFRIDPRPYEASLAQAEAARAKDEAQLVSAEADLARYSKLLTGGFQTRQSYDQQTARVAELHAAIAGDQAAIETAKLNLSFTRIRAPISGRLGAQLVDVGNLVHANDNTALVVINQVRPIYVGFALPQQTLDPIRNRQAAAPLEVEALSRDDKDVLARGRLTFIDNAIDPATGTIHLKAEFANADERLWPGEFVNVRVILRMRTGVPTVPAPTVQQGPDGWFAYVVRPDGTVQRREVQVATIQDGVAAVTKGLVPGERVVVEGQYRLTNGARVVPR